MLTKIVGFLKIVIEVQSSVRKIHRKMIRTWLQFTFYFLFIKGAFKSFSPSKNNKRQ